MPVTTMVSAPMFRRAVRPKNDSDHDLAVGRTANRSAADYPDAVPVAGLLAPATAGAAAPTGGRRGPRRRADTSGPRPPASGIRGIIRRSPTESETPGEFVDPDDAPGFVFLPTDRPDEYVIKGSDIRVVWDRAKHRWIDADGVPVTFTPAPTAGPRPFLELPPVLPKPTKSLLPPFTLPPLKLGGKPRPNPAWTHYELTMTDFKRLGLWDQMTQMAELASTFPITPIEQFWRQQPSERPTRFYRYHKFAMDPFNPTHPSSPDLLFGGGINKVEIDDPWREENLHQNLKALLKTRHDLLKKLSSENRVAKVKAMQTFQASAMSTPFIATTTNLDYALQLRDEYPPTSRQKAVVVVIEGPANRALDFEAEFRKIAEYGGGKAEWNFRTRENRAKDANQLEVGLPDLFIPMHGVSPLGFRIVEVIELGGPHDEPGLWQRLSLDQRFQLARALRLPLRQGWGS